MTGIATVLPFKQISQYHSFKSYRAAKDRKKIARSLIGLPKKIAAAFPQGIFHSILFFTEVYYDTGRVHGIV